MGNDVLASQARFSHLSEAEINRRAASVKETQTLNFDIAKSADVIFARTHSGASKIDANSDGKLDEKELTAALAKADQEALTLSSDGCAVTFHIPAGVSPEKALRLKLGQLDAAELEYSQKGRADAVRQLEAGTPAGRVGKLERAGAAGSNQLSPATVPSSQAADAPVQPSPVIPPPATASASPPSAGISAPPVSTPSKAIADAYAWFTAPKKFSTDKDQGIAEERVHERKWETLENTFGGDYDSSTPKSIKRSNAKVLQAIDTAVAALHALPVGDPESKDSCAEKVAALSQAKAQVLSADSTNGTVFNFKAKLINAFSDARTFSRGVLNDNG